MGTKVDAFVHWYKPLQKSPMVVDRNVAPKMSINSRLSRFPLATVVQGESEAEHVSGGDFAGLSPLRRPTWRRREGWVRESP
jgi:hypothetical protein